MAALDECIVSICKTVWDREFIPGVENRDNCSGFVKAVAKGLGIPLSDTANADQITDHIAESWTKVASGVEAGRMAGTGRLVLVALKSSSHTPARNNGHVAVVVGGELYRQKYPLVWGGSTGSAQSQGTKSVGEVWNRSDRDNVAYYAYGVVACGEA